MEIIGQAMYKMMVLLRNNNISIKYTGPEEGRSGPVQMHGWPIHFHLLVLYAISCSVINNLFHYLKLCTEILKA